MLGIVVPLLFPIYVILRRKPKNLPIRSWQTLRYTHGDTSGVCCGSLDVLRRECENPPTPLYDKGLLAASLFPMFADSPALPRKRPRDLFAKIDLVALHPALADLFVEGRALDWAGVCRAVADYSSFFQLRHFLSGLAQ